MRYNHRRPVETARPYGEDRCSDVRSLDANHSMVRHGRRSASDDEHRGVVESDDRMRSLGGPAVVESDDRSR
jgi:hypothetical protein